MIRLCSCGFATDDAEWFNGHLFNQPSHHERTGPWTRILTLRLPVGG